MNLLRNFSGTLLIVIVSLMSIATVAAGQSGNVTLTQNTSISLELLLAALTVAVSVGGSVFAIRNLTSQMREALAVCQEAKAHMADTSIHGEGSNFITVDVCSQRWEEHLPHIKTEIKAAMLEVKSEVTEAVFTAIKQAFVKHDNGGGNHG